MSYTASYIVNSSSAQGTTDFTFTFPYIKEEHIEVYLNYTKITQGSGSNQYQVITNVSPKLIRLNTGTASANLRVEVRRNSSLGSPLVDYADGSTLTANDLDTSALQSLYIDQELRDNQGKTVSVDEATGLPTLNNLRLTNVGDPTSAQDAATKNYVDTNFQDKSAKLTELATMAQDTAVALADLTATEVQALDGLTASTAELNILDGVTATKDEINILDGVTATKDELNILDGVTATKDEINVLDGVTATKDELNILDGVTATKDELNILDGVTATKDEINILDGVTATKDELNILDGVTATKDEINILDGVTATKDEINKLDGVTASTAEINKLDGVTATTTELNTLDGITTNTSELNKLDGVTASTAELNIVAGKSFKTSSGTLDTTSDTEIPSSKVIAAHVASSQTAIGGFTTIADEVSFPNTQPATGVVVSINNAAGVVINSSGVSTSGKRLDNTTVTINGFPDSLDGETLAAGVGLIVVSTSTANTYSYHKILTSETDVKQLSDDINDFNSRYRIASSAPGSNNDEGDLYFDTNANKMKVYNGSAWDDVASVGSFFVNTLSGAGGSDGNSSGNFDGTAKRFTLSNPGTSAQQHIVSINGVVQKPNSGTSVPSEGFAISGNDIIFSTAPASGSDFFIVTCGSSVSIGTPSANSVNSSHIIDGSIVDGDISSSAAISEGKLDIHNAPATGKYLKYTSNGMEWSDGASEGTDVKSTTNSNEAATKFLRADGDGTSSWQHPIELWYGGVKKFEATNTGTEISHGHLLPNSNGAHDLGSTSKGFRALYLADNSVAKFGNSQELEVFYDTTDSIIRTSEKLKISTTANNDDIEITPHGSGNIKLDGLDWPNADGSADQILKTDGSGALGWTTISAAPEVKLTASEAITAEDPIMVKTNGQAEKITGVNSGMSTELNLGSSGRQGANIAFDKNTDRWVAVYYDNSNSRYLYGRVGTKNGNNISWGSSCLIESCAGSTDEVESQIGLEYSPNRQKLIYGYRGCSNNRANIGILTVDTTNNTVSKAYGGGWNNNTKSPRFAMGGGLECYVWWDGSSQNKGRVTRLSYGTNSVSDQSNIYIDSSHQNSTNPDIAFGNNCFLIVFNGNTGHPFARTMGTNFTMAVGSTELASWDLPSENGPKVTYDSDNSVFVICYPIHNSHFYGQVITASTGAITYGTPFIISDNYDCRKAQSYDVSYNATAKKIIFTYVSQAGGGKYRTAVVSGSGSSATCTMDTETDLFGTNTSRESEYVHVANNDEDNVFGIITNTNSGYTAYTRVYTPSNTNMEPDRFVGFAKSSVSSGAEVTIKVNSNTSTQSGLTAGSVYYLQGDGSLGTTPSGDGTLKAGLALSSTKLLIKG